MRRYLSSLLLALICFGALLPFLQSSPADGPACCRRDGKHHCTRPAGADGFRSSAMVCPYQYLRVLTSKATALVTNRTAAPRSELLDTVPPSELSRLAFPISESCRPRGPPLS